MTLSLAAVYHGHAGELQLASFPVPRPQGGELVVRVLGTTLCGSDLHSLEGRRQVPVPTILGHEIVGEIIAFGDQAPQTDLAGEPLAIGDRITWAIVASCNECAMCRRGLPQKCLHGIKYGHEAFRTGRELVGGLAEHCLLVEGTATVRLPADLPLSVACPASCATATIAAAIEAAGTLVGRRVCVIGAGMLGLTACAMAGSHGAASIICVDPILPRREQSLRFGANETLAPDQLIFLGGSPSDDDRFDVVIELSGKTAALEMVWPWLRTGATLVLVGAVFPDAPLAWVPEQIVRRHLTIRGIHNYAPRHLLAAVRFLSAHRSATPFAELVAGWYPLAAVQDAFATASDSGAIRIGVLCST